MSTKKNIKEKPVVPHKPASINYFQKLEDSAKGVPEHDNLHQTTPSTSQPTSQPQKLRLALSGRMNRKDADQTQFFIPRVFRERIQSSCSGPVPGSIMVLAEMMLTQLEKDNGDIVRVDMTEWDGEGK